MKRVSILLALLMIFTTSAFAQVKKAPVEEKPKGPIDIKKIVIAEDPVLVGQTQLAEVHVRNSSGQDKPVTVRLKITLPNHNIITYGEKRILAKANSDTPALIPYPVDPDGAGEYTVAAKVFDTKGHLLLTNAEELDQYFYGLNPETRSEPPKRRRGHKPKGEEEQEGKKSRAVANGLLPGQVPQETKQGIFFDPPDLTWEVVELLSPAVLRGESSHIRLRLKNKGGDTAKNLDYYLAWFFTKRPNRKVKFYQETIANIAPGETKVIEVPLTIPQREQQGNYSVHALLDPDDLIKEMDESNNQMSTKNELVFGDIALELPENNHSFAEEGLYLLSWRSHKYHQFKVQISADPNFGNKEAMFELPMGENNWTSKTEIKPLKGEMPTLALALMDKQATDHLFWRVLARDSSGRLTESESRRFYITLSNRY